MSRTLNLIQRLLAMGRKLHKLGVNRDAGRILGRLSGLRELPPAVAEEVQVRLGALLLKRRRYAAARRHFAAALAAHPDEPRYHYLMGSAAAKDDRCDPKRALEHFRRAAELAPDRPRYLSRLGLAALAAGKSKEGVASLRRAAELAPDDAAVLARVIDGLGRKGHFDEAERLLRAAIFRNPRAGRFRKLWSDLRFRRLRARQLAGRRTGPAAPADAGPTLLPFVPVPPGDRPARRGPRTFRLDPAGALPPPHGGRRADQKHA
jgi:tetratricopeptide (TPR) repeat protein